METMDAPGIIWVIPDFARELSDMPRYVHTQEYIRKDKYEELKKAADELADAVQHGADQVVTNALAVYRKATGDA